ncbi:hypothetical protein CHS0354_036251 [Potamilus streckersoni]|uniref:Uncharacterized protein n=1 Tax=Potamilus streckersoni TaxID=2493646 RepID=A0AAE0W3I9_9BIVA|nr:hypothetical protein CHS0354_036251 [Potamilus streckersoni]
MAASSEDLIASDVVEEGKQNLSKGLNCPLCLKVFRSPRRLPCLHSFCQDCLQSHISNTMSRKDSVIEFPCSVCTAPVRETEENSAEKLVYLLPHDTILLSALLESNVKVNLLCDVCQAEDIRRPAEQMCLICEEALCKYCCMVHKNSKVSRTHLMLNIEELPHKRNIVLQHNSFFNCTRHPHSPLELFCKTHGTQICAKCVNADHADCSKVVRISHRTTNLSKTLTQMKTRVKLLEEKLDKMAEINLSNLNHLASQINDFTLEIQALKNSIVDVLDDVGRRIKKDGEIILAKERKRTEQLNKDYLSQNTAIRNSNIILEKVTQVATTYQLSLLSKQMTSQLSMSEAQIEEMYKRIDPFTLQLEISSQIKTLTTIPKGEIAKLKRASNRELQIRCDEYELQKESKAVYVDVKEVRASGDKVPWYSDVTYVSGNQLMISDCNNKMCHLLDSTFNIVSSYQLSDFPWQLSSAKDSEVAVSIPTQKTIMLFSVKDNNITSTRKIRTRYICYGVTVVSEKMVIVSGPCNDGKRLYWSLVSLDGKEKSFHEFDGVGTGQTFVTLNAMKTRLYISACWNDSLFCFDLEGRTYFTFKHQNLKLPYSIALDRYDYVYVAGSGSNNILQLSPDGSLLQIIVSGMEKMPMGICFDKNGDTFAVTYMAFVLDKLFCYGSSAVVSLSDKLNLALVC